MIDVHDPELKHNEKILRSNNNKMRSKILFICLMFVLTAFVSNDNSKKEINSIELYYVDYEIETPFKIDYNNFKKVFRDEINYINITDSSTMNIIKEHIDEVRNIKGKSLPDVRQFIKISYVGSKELDIICLDGESSISINDNPVIFCKKFQKFINCIAYKIRRNKILDCKKYCN